jgi:hypothetical protein
MTTDPAPIEPGRRLPEPSWEHYALFKSVREAIATLPVYFRTETHISGIMATDLPSPKSQAAIAIVAELERLLDFQS